MIIMSGQILFIDEQIVIPVQFPKLAINDVKMFVTKILGDLIDVFFFFQNLNDVE